MEAGEYGKYSTLDAMNSSKWADCIILEELSNKLHIRLSTEERTLKATTSQIIQSAGFLTRRFRTDKAQLRYKQLAKHFGSLYADYLKSKTKYLWVYVGGVVYTNNLGLYKLFLVRTVLVKIPAGVWGISSRYLYFCTAYIQIITGTSRTVFLSNS